MSEQQLAIRREDAIQPAAEMRAATDCAGACAEIIKRTKIRIRGKDYIPVEGWQSLARANGCIPSVASVRREDDGYVAVAEVRRITDGTVLSSAEGFVGDDEDYWKDQPRFARRAMAQTRAISRVCASAFRFIVVLIDRGLETTPAEEIDGVVLGPHKARISDAAPAATTSSGGTAIVDAEFQLEPTPADGWPPAGTTEVIGPTTVVVRVKDGETRGKAWRAYFIDAQNGRECGTFDRTIGEGIADEAHFEQPVLLAIKPSVKREGSFELLGWRRAQ